MQLSRICKILSYFCKVLFIEETSTKNFKLIDLAMNSISIASRSDIMGALASGLCLLHCLATPLLFVANAHAVVAQEAHPEWWGVLDLVFLVVSFIAVYWSVKNTSKLWMRYIFWSSWSILAFVVFNEKLALAPLAEEFIYLPTLALIFAHLYNRRYCGCKDETCCASEITEEDAQA